MTKTAFVRNGIINENFTEVPNLAIAYFNSSPNMNRTYVVNSVANSSDDTFQTRNFNGASTVQLYDEDDDDEPRTSTFCKVLGFGFLLCLAGVSIAFLVFAIFYDDLIDSDNEDAEEYWERMGREIKELQNQARIALYNRTLQNATKLENEEDFISIIRDGKNVTVPKVHRDQMPLKPGITYENFINGDFNPKTFNGKWISNNELLYYDLLNNLCITDVSDMNTTVLIDSHTIERLRLSGLALSADRKYFLNIYNARRIFRYSSSAKYRIFSINDSQLSPALAAPEYPQDLYLLHAEWGPIGSQIVFVFRNDIYYKSDVNSEPIRLTRTGIETVVFNGIPDWVYEEEIISGPKTFWMSADGQKLVYATINDTEVAIQTWPFYGTKIESDGNYNQYTKIVSVRYPKPGRPNPTVNMYFVALNESTQMNANNNSETMEEKVSIHLHPPNDIKQLGDHYFTAFKWIDNDWFAINWMNRAQNFSVMTVYSHKTNLEPISNFKLQSKNGWIDLFTEPLITPDQSSYIIKVPKMSDNKKQVFPHIAKVSISSTEADFLTSGIFEVKEILDINVETERLYFMATYPSKPGEKHLLSVALNQSIIRSEPICHTCLMNVYRPDKDNVCLVSDVKFSKTGEYYILDCLGPNIPYSEIRKTTDDSLVHTLEENKQLEISLKNISLPKNILMKVPVQSYEIDVMLIVPEDFDEKALKKYPIIFHVYGGPGSDSGSVTQQYFYNQFSAYMASNRSVIYGLLDARGSPNHGSKFMFDIYRRIGTVEVEDTIAVARYLRNNTTYINPNAISLWGWSYGGYLTTMSLETDRYDPVFSCGIAVAPVSDWMYYDSVYVERYMGFPTPEDNLKNYLKSSTLDKVQYLRGKKYLIMFGTADDNVHTQNSMMLLKALNEANINYQTQVYPDNNHALQNYGTVEHLYRRMTDFLDKCYDNNEAHSPQHS